MDDVLKLAKDLKKPPKDVSTMIGTVGSMNPISVIIGNNDILLKYGVNLMICNLFVFQTDGVIDKLQVGDKVLIAKTDFGIEKYVLMGKVE